MNLAQIPTFFIIPTTFPTIFYLINLQTELEEFTVSTT